MTEIIHAVSAAMNVPAELIRARTRRRDIVEARFICAYLMKQHTKMTLTEIGWSLNRDHTTIIHALKAVGDRMDTEPAFRETVRSLRIQTAPRVETLPAGGGRWAA